MNHVLKETSMDNDFLAAYRQQITNCLRNDFDDNWDEYRFGPENMWPRKGVLYDTKNYIKKLLSTFGLYDQKKAYESLLGSNVEHFQWVYQNLADQESRRLLIQVLSFRALGYRRVKLPLNNSSYWEAMKNAEKLTLSSESIDLGCKGRRAHKIDTTSVGYNIELFTTPLNYVCVFVLHHYESVVLGNVVKAQAGDVVIDAGGCYGDTALYFAHEVGETGKVITFEFMPENLVIFEVNMSINPELSKRVRLVKSPMWSNSGELLFVEGKGPGTRVTSNASDPDATRVETLSIDDMVNNEKLDRVDFVKMDIEGAELESLKGAENTIRKFRPKLAISVYHQLSDFWTIPEYIDRLGLGYQFALRHYTIHAEETVVFAY